MDLLEANREFFRIPKRPRHKEVNFFEEYKSASKTKVARDQPGWKVEPRFGEILKMAESISKALLSLVKEKLAQKTRNAKETEDMAHQVARAVQSRRPVAEAEPIQTTQVAEAEPVLSRPPVAEAEPIQSTQVAHAESIQSTHVAEADPVQMSEEVLAAHPQQGEASDDDDDDEELLLTLMRPKKRRLDDYYGERDIENEEPPLKMRLTENKLDDFETNDLDDLMLFRTIY